MMVAKTTTTTMLCFYLLVLVAVVAAATTTTTTSKSAHPPPPSRKPITLKLHHRIHLDNSSYESYVQSRLRGERRDWVAAKSMRTELLQQQQQQNISYGQEEDSGFPLALSNPFVRGQYLVELGIGNPRSFFLFQLDSGNLVSWLQCEPCETCYKQADPIYDPTPSLGFRKVLDGDLSCEDLRGNRQNPGPNGECRYLVKYGEGSSTQGYLIEDRLTLIPDGGGRGEPFDGVPFGCSTKSDPQLAGEQAGIIALSRGPLSLVSILGIKSFSYCLVDPMDRDKVSTLVLNPDMPPPSDVSYGVKLLSRGPQGEKFFYVDLRAIAVNNEIVQVPQDAFELQPNNNAVDTGVILDSGADLTYFPQKVYEPLSDIFERETQAPVVDSPSDFYDLCFDVKGLPSDHNYVYPKLTYYFDENTAVPLDVRSYIDESIGEDIDCFSIVGYGALDSIIGSNQQYGNRFYFDLVKNEVKVSSNDCI